MIVSLFTAVTEAVAKMEEINDADEGLGFGGWLFLGILAAMALALVICTVRKLAMVRIILIFRGDHKK